MYYLKLYREKEGNSNKRSDTLVCTVHSIDQEWLDLWLGRDPVRAWVVRARVPPGKLFSLLPLMMLLHLFSHGHHLDC